MRNADNPTSNHAVMEARMAGQTRALVVGLLVCALGAGCKSAPTAFTCVPTDFPRELDKVHLPPYTVEPPDILVIDAIRTVPKATYRIEVSDTVVVQFGNPLPNEPNTIAAMVEADGMMNLGTPYGGPLRVAGLTATEAKEAIEKKVPQKNPLVTVTIAQSRAAQRIAGPHLVRPDGTVGLGVYGSVQITGLTLPAVKKMIEAHLAEYFHNPEVSVDVQGYNSKLFYVIMDGGGAGQQVFRLPITGNETVLDAIAQVNGLSPVSSTDNIWVARPAPAGGPHQILPVNWQAVSALADTGTNYQLMPGDRVYVAAQHLVAADTFLARVLSPIERLLGVTLLGNYTFRSVAGQNVNGFGGP
jgi:polysaccharide biosynthesis/export protein